MDKIFQGQNFLFQGPNILAKEIIIRGLQIFGSGGTKMGVRFSCDRLRVKKLDLQYTT